MERIGFSVFEAENGEEAVMMFKKIKPDVVIMDIIMPVMDGVKAMHKIKKTKLGKQIPVIALTASGFDDKRDQLISAGFDDYVLKPFTESILLKSISEHSNIEFVFDDENEIASDFSEEITIKNAIDDWNKMNETLQNKLFEFIEVQELEEISKIAQDNDFKGNFHALSVLLNKAVESFDFYLLNQLLEVIHKSSNINSEIE